MKPPGIKIPQLEALKGKVQHILVKVVIHVICISLTDANFIQWSKCRALSIVMYIT